MKYSQAEKLQLMMLCEIYRVMGIENSFNPDLVEEAISTDNYWALSWEYPSLETEDETPSKVKLFVDTVDMYDMLSYTYERLSDEDKKNVSEAVPHFSPEYSLTFPGFDGNNESEYMQIGRLLKTMGRFSGTELTKNSHAPSVETYRRMLDIFLPIRHKFVFNEGIRKQELIDILLERIHPSNR
ncbi:YfbU family protein [Proteus mirabilis]